ncbi:MAG: hypothetical protein HY812_08300 [Planctomycetes bacterium]|nr:hypothetical protein [Planctomycetota bacterium]
MKGIMVAAVAALVSTTIALERVSWAGGARKAEFEAPVRLLADGKFLNEVENMLYPSPVLLDVDSDGQRELVCGDLWGRLRVYENVGEEGDTTWGPAVKLQSEGKDLELPNW